MKSYDPVYMKDSELNWEAEKDEKLDQLADLLLWVKTNYFNTLDISDKQAAAVETLDRWVQRL